MLSTLDDQQYSIPDEKVLVELLQKVVMDSITYIDDSSNITIAKQKGILARQKMQEFSGEMITEIIKGRLREQGLNRGWEF